jgi:hypothetical protein
VDLFNWLTTGLFRIVFYPFRAMEPIWALTVVSFLTGIIALWVFGKVSNQETIRTVRDRIRGNILGIRIFGDDIGLLFRLQGRVMRQTLTYLRHAAWPLVVMFVPLTVIFIQLNLWFTSRPLEVGDTATVKVILNDDDAITDGVMLTAPEGIVIETPGVRIPSKSEVAWRIRAVGPGDHMLTVQVGDAEAVEKNLLIGGAWDATSSRRTGRNLLHRLGFPGEPGIDPDTRVESVEVLYPVLDISFFIWGINWIYYFLIASVLFGFAFKGVMGVEI